MHILGEFWFKNDIEIIYKEYFSLWKYLNYNNLIITRMGGKIPICVMSDGKECSEFSV